LFLIRGYEAGLKRRKSFRYWDDLERTQWCSVGQLHALQLTALKRLLEHAGRNSAYCAQLWPRMGLHPGDLEQLDDLQSWPLLRREEIRRHLANMRCRLQREALISKATGGSSGTPLQFYLNEDSDDRRMAAWHRGYSWAGAGPGTRQVYLWGVALGDRPWRARLKDHLYQTWLYRRRVLNTFDLNDDTMSQYLRRYNRCRPDALVAYTNPLYAFARWLDENKLTPYSPRSIVVGAEKLHGFQRELIERVFRAPVFETYGSREFMLIGAECDRHEGLHLTMENLLVEVVDDDGRPVPAGQEGQVVVTDLYNYGMPFIRYVTGDRAIAGFTQCSCGRGLPLLRKVIGRQLDILTTPAGRQIPGEFFPHLIKDFAAVRRFQVIQPNPHEIVLRLVVDDHWFSATRDELTRIVHDELGEAFTLRIDVVDDIPLTRAGKLQVVVNQCASNGLSTSTSRS
jgi:phenylacetate-CoA ligase